MRTLLRIGLSICLMLAFTVSLGALTVLVWNNANGSYVTQPETGGLWGCSNGLHHAINDNGVQQTVADFLPANISGYDAIFITLGVWCLDSGSVAPGTISAYDQGRLIEYLENGGALYIEGVDVGADHASTTFFEYLGVDYLADDSGVVTEVNGVTGTFMTNNSFEYANAGEADYLVDVLGAGEGVVFQQTQNNTACGVYYYNPTFQYHVITSSVIFGAYTNGASQNTRQMQMARYLTLLNAEPEPSIESSVDDIDFGAVYQGYPETQTLDISNMGIEALDISSISVSGSVLSLSETGPISLVTGESLTLEITCDPAAVATLDETITLASNDPDGDLTIPVHADCMQQPTVDIAAECFVSSLEPGQIDNTQTLTLGNTGAIELTYYIEAINTTANTDAVDFVAGASTSTPAQSRDSGGPDDFGYWWIDSNDPNGPSYVWEDISTTGVEVTNWIATDIYDPRDEGYAGPFDIGFAFPFYGEEQTVLYINSNGFIGFDIDSVNEPARTNCDIPNSSEPNHIICPLWDDMDGSVSGNVYTQQVGDEFVIQWENWGFCFSSQLPITMQLRLNEQGVITVYYNHVVSSSTATIGIENASGSDGLEVCYFETYATENLALMFHADAAWLSLDSNAGEIAAGQSVDIGLDISAELLDTGVYEAALHIMTNDPETPSVYIPVTLTVEESTLTSATITVSCNSGISPEGAELVLTNLDGNPNHVYCATVPPDSVLALDTVAVGTYDLEVSLYLYDDYIVEDLEVTENFTCDVELIETLYAPTNMQTEVTDEGVLMTWDGPPSRPFVEYNIYLDGDEYTYGPHNYYLWEYLQPGLHMVGASCVYATGESDVTEVEVKVVGINSGDIPAVTSLHGVYPNPFNPETTVRFSLAQPAHTRVEVFNTRGQLVKTLLDDSLPAGEHSLAWRSRNDSGAACASGLYFIRMTTDEYQSIWKALLLK